MCTALPAQTGFEVKCDVQEEGERVLKLGRRVSLDNGD